MTDVSFYIFLQELSSMRMFISSQCEMSERFYSVFISWEARMRSSPSNLWDSFLPETLTSVNNSGRGCEEITNMELKGEFRVWNSAKYEVISGFIV